jgi:hypothetical protein
MDGIKPPTQFELAMLAATVSRGTTQEPLEAVSYAWELWYESGGCVQHGGLAAWALYRSIEDPAVLRSWRERGHAPRKFPATLDDFLRLIVKAKTPADSMKKLRDFFRHEQAQRPQLYGDPAGRIAEIKAADRAGGYFADFKRWQSMACVYEIWWADQKSLKASNSAKKRKPRS